MSKEGEDFEMPIKTTDKGKDIDIHIGSMTFTYNKKFLYWAFMVGMIILVISLIYINGETLNRCNNYYINYIKHNCTCIVEKVKFNFSIN
jgi:cell division protein FtsL